MRAIPMIWLILAMILQGCALITKVAGNALRIHPINRAQSGLSLLSSEEQPAISIEIEDQPERKSDPSILVIAGVVGASTGMAVVLLKSSIAAFQTMLYEDLADLLPKPAFYWPLFLYPVIGGLMVSLLRKMKPESFDNGFEKVTDLNFDKTRDLLDQFVRSSAAVLTLGSGCSLGPEGPAVELGARISSLFFSARTINERRSLFLSGIAAGVASGFNAPLAGIFFAIECGTKYLVKVENKLSVIGYEGDLIGPARGEAFLQSNTWKSSVAALCIAASVANIVVGVGLHEKNALSVQGNLFAMKSPFFEIPLYIGLGVVSGLVAHFFESLNAFVATYTETKPERNVPVTMPIVGGLLCGVTAVFYPQTLFVGYSTLDQLLSGGIKLTIPLASSLLGLKLFLSSVALNTGLVGGVFAPSLFFGAMIGTLYHDVVIQGASLLRDTLSVVVDGGGTTGAITTLASTLETSIRIANAPAYATVGAASCLAAVFDAPLTSSILMLELTENHEIVVPLIISAAASSQTKVLLGRNEQE